MEFAKLQTIRFWFVGCVLKRFWKEDVICKHGSFPENYEKWIFTYFHVTTSANECASIKKHGLLDLKNSYRCADSELRIFLDNQGIEIDIDNCILKHNGREYIMSFQL